MASRFLQQVRREQGPQRRPRTQCLYYLLNPGRSHLTLSLAVARAQPNGYLDALQPYQVQPAHLKRPPLFLEDSDAKRLQQLVEWDPQWLHSSKRELPRAADPQWLQSLIASGRVRDANGMSAIWSDPLELDCVWGIDDEGNQRLNWRSLPGIHVLPTSPLGFWDSLQCRAGLLSVDLQPDALIWVEKSLLLMPEDVAAFIKTHGAAFTAWGLPLPRQLTVTSGSPLPQAQLYFYSVAGERGRTTDHLQLRFQYACAGVSTIFDTTDSDTSRRLFLAEENNVIIVSRDPRAEAALTRQLHESLVEQAPRSLPGGNLGFASSARWQTVMTDVLPTLKKQGWQTDVESGFRHHFVKADQVNLLTVRHGQDWFDLALNVEIDGEVIPLMHVLAGCARRYSLATLRGMAPNALLPLSLPDGRQLLISAARIARWLAALVELNGSQPVGESLRLPLAQLDRLNALDDGDLGEWGETDQFLQRARELRRPPGLDGFSLPPAFHADLRHYQRLGVAWLQQRRALGVGGILADDMGLGKTVQALAHLAIEKHEGRLCLPTLVVAPTSVLDNWQQEARRFAPQLQCLLMHGPERHRHWAKLAEQDVLLTSYALVAIDIEHWQQQGLSAVILDEAQAIKNSRAQVTRHVSQLQAPYKLCMTGTPLENHLGELWSQFDFMMPGFLDTEARFKLHYRKPIEDQGDQVRAQGLMERIAPFILRRRKEEVARELPPKTEVILRLPMQEAQRDLYEMLRLRSVSQLKLAAPGGQQGVEVSRDRIRILSALMQLRQVCCDPELLALPEYPNVLSAKREYLLDMLRDLVDEGRSILVFSQFTSMLKLIAGDLKKMGIQHLMLTGQSRNRGALVDKFQNAEAPVFLISLKAGGIGLNLTRADTVIHYDPWWNSAAENQATDRAYRIGQDKPVFVYKLLTEGTVEEKIHALQLRKQNLLEQVYQVAEANTQQLALDNTALLGLLDNQ